MKPLNKIIAKLFKEIADKFDNNQCEASDAEAQYVINLLTHRVMSKEMACKYMNLSRSRFDDLVREGKLPKGRKRTGFKEIIFWQDELDACKKK